MQPTRSCRKTPAKPDPISIKRGSLPAAAWKKPAVRWRRCGLLLDLGKPEMNIARTLQRLKEWQARRSRHMMPAAAFRAGLVRNFLIVALFALAGEAALLS